MRKNNQDRGAHQSLGIGTVESKVTHPSERRSFLRLIAHNLIHAESAGASLPIPKIVRLHIATQIAFGEI
jgi:hypothetical protein